MRSAFVSPRLSCDMASASLSSTFVCRSKTSTNKPDDLASVLSDDSFQVVSEAPTYSADVDIVDLPLAACLL